MFQQDGVLSHTHIFKLNVSFAKAKTALPFALCER